MATITRVTMGREGHYRYYPLRPGTSTMEAAECQCGATWTKGENPQWDGFCHWASDHKAPTVRRAFVTEACRGSFGLIHEGLTDGPNGSYVGWCSKCERYRPTSPQEGYEQWRQFDPHPIFVAVKP